MQPSQKPLTWSRKQTGPSGELPVHGETSAAMGAGPIGPDERAEGSSAGWSQAQRLRHGARPPRK